MTRTLRALATPALLGALALAPAAQANGVFNGPTTGGDAVPLENGRETPLSSFLEAHRDCALKSFEDIYRQVYPQYRGPLESVNSSGPIDVGGEYDPEGPFFYTRDGVKRIFGFYWIGPKDAALYPGEVPPQLTFALNGDFYTRGFYRDYKPEPRFDGSVFVSRFESNPDVNLLASFPGVQFQTEKRVDGYDALGRPVGERYVISGQRVVLAPDHGKRVPFRNALNDRPTVVTWNAEGFVACLAAATGAR